MSINIYLIFYIFCQFCFFRHPRLIHALLLILTLTLLTKCDALSFGAYLEPQTTPFYNHFEEI